MNPVTLITAIQALTGLATEAVDLVSNTEAAFSTTDQATLQAELTKLQAANDALTTTVQAKLWAAAGS